MKTVFLSFTLLLSTLCLFAQSDRFQKGMEANIALLDSAKSPDDFTTVAAAFERIGDAEKTQWLPYYYAALANIWKGFTDAKANKDDVADKADALIAKAEAIAPKNSEIALEKSMAATLHMLVDPQARWQQYGSVVNSSMETAKQLDVNNPRIYYWEGQNLFGTPTQFGGGKDKAKPLFEKSLALYKTAKHVSSIYPAWGEKSAQAMLERCK
ncbi:MAG: hypothetical protein JWR18_3632 [Segetibacter sp.]|jgi:hypothetical protein|nr:hypothetical protein [Segetibacter sp.]